MNNVKPTAAEALLELSAQANATYNLIVSNPTYSASMDNAIWLQITDFLMNLSIGLSDVAARIETSPDPAIVALNESVETIFEALADVSAMLENRIDGGSIDAIRAAHSTPVAVATAVIDEDDSELDAPDDEAELVVSPLSGDIAKYSYIRYTAILRQSRKALKLRLATGDTSIDKGVWLARSQIVYNPDSPKSMPGLMPVTHWLADKVGLTLHLEITHDRTLTHQWGKEFMR